MRRIIAGPDRQEMWEFQERMAEGESGLRDAWVITIRDYFKWQL